MFPAPAIGRSRYFSRRLGLEPSADLRQHGNAVLTCRSAKASESFGGRAAPLSPCPFAGTGFEWPSPGFFSQRPLLLELDPIQPATRSQETGSQSGGRVLHYWVKAARLPFKVVHRGSLPK